MQSENLPFNLKCFQTVYDDNPQAFCIVYVARQDGVYRDITFIYVNKAYEKMSGFSREKLIGHTYSDIFGKPSSQWNELYGEVAYCLKEKRVILPGPEINGFVSIQCYQIAEGYCGSNVLDITKETAAVEKAERESREVLERISDERTKYHFLLDQSSAMITVIDAETYRIVYANAAACEVTKDFDTGYIDSVCYKSIAHEQEPCKNCILAHKNSTEEVKEILFGNRIYRMIYKRIEWNGRDCLLEYSEDITEQKQVIRMAEENARLHENIIANIPMGIIVYKLEKHTYKVLQVNPATCKMMGFSPNDAIGTSGESILFLVHPDDKKIVVDSAVRMAISEDVVHYEFRSRVGGGQKYIWLSADGKRGIQPNGDVYIYVGYKDITDSKEREMEFQQKVDFISNLNDEKLIFKGRHNLTKNLVVSIEGKTNGSVDDVCGKKYDDLLPRLVATATRAEKQEEIAKAFNRQNLINAFAEGKREFFIDYQRSLNDSIHTWSTHIWSTLKCSLYEEPISHDIYAFLYSYDSTDQIQESQIVRRLSTLEYNMLGLIDGRTRRFKVVYMKNVPSEKYKDLQGDYNDTLRRKCEMSQILSDKERLLQEMSLDHIIRQLQVREIYETECSEDFSNGKFRRTRFYYSYLDEDKETIIFFSSDITEYYLREQEQVHKIEEALAQAQNANRAKTQFFSRMSHDMRTPMNGILGMTSLSENETDAGVLKENMKKIRESGKYLLSLINDTLDFQRIESGKLKLEPQIVNTREVVQNILDIIGTAAKAKGVNVRFNPGNADLKWFVKVDSVRIKQVFINLLSNAVKFTPSGGTVELSSQLLFREGMISHDVFTIRDTGIGMSEDFLKNKIFQPFSQENNKVTANYAGSGLGLSIAKSLVELMGGSISVESELGVGTTFTVHLDLERVDPREAEKALQNKKIQSSNLSAELKGKQILLAEDHPLNAEIAVKLLEKAGCIVTWMQNGQTALDCFASSPLDYFDAVLMDIRMPIMDGLQSTRLIRSLARSDAKTVPIVAMTANAYDEDVKKSLDAGMNKHLGKPIEPSLLYSTLASVIKENE